MKLKKIHLFFIILLSFSLLPFFKYFLGYTIESMTTQTRKINDSTFTKTSDENNNTLYTASTPMGNAAVYKNNDGEIAYGTSNNSDNTKTITTSDGRIVYANYDNTVNGINNNNNENCPPCPPCGRCPEPSFECVKRPTYQADNPYLPMPVLADFSQFGM